MGFTKVDKEKFLRSCDFRRSIMPTEVIETQKTLFEDIMEYESQKPAKYQHLKLHFKYPPLDDNPDGNPIPKQSARFTVMRHKSDDVHGNKKGDVLVYINKRNNKKDVIISSYPETKIVNTEKMIKEQIFMQLKEKYPNFRKFTGCIHITRLEIIFKAPLSAPKYMMDDLRNGTKIYFRDTKPDLDNTEKLIFDALQEVVYDNDARIVSKNGIFKRYGITPGVIIELEGEI